MKPGRISFRGLSFTAQQARGEQALLAPLAAAVEAVSRLDARAGCASDRVAEGLRRRLALREAAGWLAHQGAWIHPTDLALREAGLTGSYTAAAITGRLRSALPATSDAGPPDLITDDLAVSCALQLGRLWLRLAERRSWAPLASADALRQTLGQLGQYGYPDEALTEFLGRFAGKPGTGSYAVPPLLRAGEAAQAWMSEYVGAGEGRADRLSTSGLFLAACLWRRGTPAAAIALSVSVGHAVAFAGARRQDRGHLAAGFPGLRHGRGAARRAGVDPAAGRRGADRRADANGALAPARRGRSGTPPARAHRPHPRRAAAGHAAGGARPHPPGLPRPACSGRQPGRRAWRAFVVA